jgi:hypothetical protein
MVKQFHRSIGLPVAASDWDEAEVCWD